MERLKRFIVAVEYLKTKAEEPTNEGVAKLLKYKALNYISDIIGGSKEINPFVLERMVEFSINPDWIETGNGEMVKPPPKRQDDNETTSHVILDTSTVKVTLQDYIDLLKTINKKEEERGKELLSIIKELAASQKAIGDALAPIKEKTEELLSNSNSTLDRISLVETIIRSDDTVIMNNQDRMSGNEVGTSATEAGNRQLVADKRRKGKGSQSDVRR
jgi:hypothetical protein